MKRANGEGSVYRHEDGKRWWAAVTVDGRRVRRLRRNRTLAQEALGELLKDKRRGTLGRERPTVATLLDDWLASVTDLRPRTLNGYRAYAEHHVKPALGDIELRELTPQDVERAMRAWRDKGLSARTVSHLRALLRNALNVGIRWGLVEVNVAGLARPPKVPRYEVRPLTLADAQRLREAVADDRLAALYLLALSRGLSLSEALGLRWSDIDLENGTLAIPRSMHRVDGAYRFEEPKNEHRRRTVALPPQLVAAFREHRKRQDIERDAAADRWLGDEWPGLVFRTTEGRPLNPSVATHRLQALVERAGLPRITFHQLRHAAVSLMAAQGVPLRDIMETVGHSQPQTTMAIYAHVAPDSQRESAAKVAAALWGE